MASLGQKKLLAALSFYMPDIELAKRLVQLGMQKEELDDYKGISKTEYAKRVKRVSLLE